MSTPEVAEYLGIPVSTLHAWRSASIAPPCAKLGRHLRWRKADVDDWLAERTSVSSSRMSRLRQ